MAAGSSGKVPHWHRLKSEEGDYLLLQPMLNHTEQNI